MRTAASAGTARDTGQRGNTRNATDQGSWNGWISIQAGHSSFCRLSAILYHRRRQYNYPMRHRWNGDRSEICIMQTCSRNRINILPLLLSADFFQYNPLLSISLINERYSRKTFVLAFRLGVYTKHVHAQSIPSIRRKTNPLLEWCTTYNITEIDTNRIYPISMDCIGLDWVSKMDPCPTLIYTANVRYVFG